MDSQTKVEEFVWRKIWRRFWHYGHKTWRRVLTRVPANYSPTSYPPPSTDPQLITYADCEAFFEAATGGSRDDLIDILNVNGPEVITELSKSYNEQGETPLLAAIKRGNDDVVKFLVGKLDVPIRQIGRFVWRDVEYLEVPALYVAVVHGEMGIAAYLLSKEVDSDQTNEMIDSIISSSNDRQAKINILELMGAVNFYFHETHPKPENGLMYWREALNIRNATIDGKPGIPKTSPPSDFARMTFDFTSEFTTLEQLDQLSTLQLFTQAVLVSHRVLNTVSPGPHIFTLIFLCQYASINCFREGRQVIDILTFCLQKSQELQWKEDNESKIINWALYIMTKVITNMREKRSVIGQEEFTFANLMATFDFATSYLSDRLENRKIKESFTPFLAKNILEMITWLTEMMPQLNSQERQHFVDSLSVVIRKDHRWGNANQNQNFLHMICFNPIPSEMPDVENDELNDLVDNASDILNFDNDFDSDAGSDVDLDSDSDINFDDFLDYNSMYNVTDNYSTGYRYNNLMSSNFEDVSGCPSCGEEGEWSSDESDDEDFLLIRNHHANMGTRNRNMATSPVDLQFSVAQLLLRLGADPNATDSHGQTSLHYLGMIRGSVTLSRLLLEYGGHIDQRDAKNKTPLMLFQTWESELTGQRDLDLKGHLQYLINYSLPLPLKCLAARAVSKNQVPFDQDQIPLALQSFIKRH